MLALLRSGLSERAATVPYTYKYLGRPTPRGLLSSPRGMDVSSLALVEIPIQLGLAMVAREAWEALTSFRAYADTSFQPLFNLLPLSHHRYYRIPTSFPPST